MQVTLHSGLHSDKLIEHFRNPKNAGELSEPAVCVDAVNAACGDTLRLYARWEGGKITAIAYKSRGCTASIACGSALTEIVLGKTRDQLKTLHSRDIEEAVGGLAPESRHAAALCIDAVKTLLAKAG